MSPFLSQSIYIQVYFALFSLSLLCFHELTLVVLIYHPPKASTTFLSELSELLTSLGSKFLSTLLIRDFNFQVDSTSCSFATEFLSLLHCLNFTHPRGPGYLAVSDHQAVLFALPLPNPPPSQRPCHTISFRAIKSVNPVALSSLLQINLAPEPPMPHLRDLSLTTMLLYPQATTLWPC